MRRQLFSHTNTNSSLPQNDCSGHEPHGSSWAQGHEGSSQALPQPKALQITPWCPPHPSPAPISSSSSFWLPQWVCATYWWSMGACRMGEQPGPSRCGLEAMLQLGCRSARKPPPVQHVERGVPANTLPRAACTTQQPVQDGSCAKQNRNPIKI